MSELSEKRARFEHCMREFGSSIPPQEQSVGGTDLKPEGWPKGGLRGAKAVNELYAEIERLTRERDGARDEAERMRRTRDEAIRRLRAALRQIVDIETEYESCAELAREALGEPKP